MDADYPSAVLFPHYFASVPDGYEEAFEAATGEGKAPASAVAAIIYVDAGGELTIGEACRATGASIAGTRFRAVVETVADHVEDFAVDDIPQSNPRDRTPEPILEKHGLTDDD